jgi:ABC-type branched-subunit amino acid transport system substrate-binding protein
MRRLPIRTCRLLLVGATLAYWPGGSAFVRATTENSLTAQEQRGKEIYLRGTSPSGKDILAYLGEASFEVPGSAVTCANCHGVDGHGKPEGGVRPSNLTWEALTKPYGLKHADGRQHPPYTARGLELAITRGTDPAGNRLQSVMPRYQMSREDLADLVAYLRSLGRDRDPGISDDTIVIGTAAPAKGPLADMGQALKAVTGAFFDQLNKQGGIYNRRVEVKFIETAETPAATRASVERVLIDEPVFAMTGAFIAGAEREVVPLMAQQGVPLIGPLTLYPQTGFPLNRQVFYLLSGMDGQGRALLEFAARSSAIDRPAIAVVYPQSEVNASVLEAIADQSRKRGLNEPRRYDYATGHFDVSDAVKQLEQAGRDAVIFMGTVDEALSFIREADKRRWFPAMFLPSGSSGADLFEAPVSFNGKLYASFPNAPPALSGEGVNDFRSLSGKYRLPTQHVAAQMSAYSAARILVEAMRRVGKDLSREKLIQALEGLYEFSTGLTPAITFGPNRRIGAMGTYVVTIDLKERRFVPVSGWVGVN